MDFSLISRSHVERALDRLRAGEVPSGYLPSTHYDVFVGAERFAPKQVIAIAYHEATGRMPPPSSFRGEEDSPAFRKLEEFGYSVRLKDNVAHRRYWWVNQNQTHKQEVGGGYLWSPKVSANGTRNPFYDFMKEVRPGDIVLSYYDQHISAVGVALASAITAPKPDFGKAGEAWSNEGWLVYVEFEQLPVPFSPKQNFEKIRELMPEKYAPLGRNGEGQQRYLTGISEALYNRLRELAGPALDVGITELTLDDEAAHAQADEDLVKGLEGRTDIGDTMKQQLVASRRGQGIFKKNVRLNEKKCRVTGLSDMRLLIASHIKPWSESNDFEKLHGCNGLLLSPHIDKLFDKGFISFSDQGDVLLSPKMRSDVLAAWGIAFPLNVGSFLPGQCAFLAYHRAKHKFSV